MFLWFYLGSDPDEEFRGSFLFFFSGRPLFLFALFFTSAPQIR